MDAPRKILLTTSRNPTPRIRSFCNDLARVIPGLVTVNRGKLSVDGVAEKALEYGADRVVIVDRGHDGEPGKIGFFQVGASGLRGVPPILYIAGIRLQREFGHSGTRPTSSLAITTPSKGKKTAKFASSLSSFFNIPAFLAGEKPSKYATEMRVSYDAARRIQITFTSAFQNVEIGPRITLSKVMWRVNG